MDYEKAMKDLKESGNYWKAPEGKTVVVPTSEMGEPKKETINGKESLRCEIKINVNGAEKIWGMTFGGSSSTYGKLIAIGQKHKTLIGVPIEIIRQGTDKENTKYIILDASQPQDSIGAAAKAAKDAQIAKGFASGTPEFVR